MVPDFYISGTILAHIPPYNSQQATEIKMAPIVQLIQQYVYTTIHIALRSYTPISYLVVHPRRRSRTYEHP